MQRSTTTKNTSAKGKSKGSVRVRKASKVEVLTPKASESKSKRVTKESKSIRPIQGNILKPKTPKGGSQKVVSTKAKSKQLQNTKTLIRTNGKTQKRKIILLKSTDFINGRYDLDDQAYIEYYPNFLTAAKQKMITQELVGSKTAEKYDEKLESDVPWTHGIYSMFGRDIPTPRLLYAMRDEGEDIRNSYTVTDSIPWTKEMEKLRDSVSKTSGKYCRYAQMNLYRTGEDYIGFHTDSEVQKDDLIASISLGAERTFRFLDIDFKEKDTPIYSMTLEPGSLLIMSEYAAKHNWKHEVPKDKDVEDMRINITFRPN